MLKKTLYDIRNQYGVDILTQEKLAISYLRDLMPGDLRVYQRMRIFYESDTHLTIAKMMDTPAAAYSHSVENYIDYAQCSDEIGQELLDAVFYALKLQESECSQVKMNLASFDSMTTQHETYGNTFFLGRVRHLLALRDHKSDIQDAKNAATQVAAEIEGLSEYDIYKLGAMEQDSDCMVMLSESYREGVHNNEVNIEKNPELSKRWLTAAAKLNHPTALFNLATEAYCKGDYNTARSYCAKAIEADKRHPRTHDAFYLMGLCWYHGHGCAKNPTMALKSFLVACSEGSHENRDRARMYLKLCYEAGYAENENSVAIGQIKKILKLDQVQIPEIQQLPARISPFFILVDSSESAQADKVNAYLSLFLRCLNLVASEHTEIDIRIAVMTFGGEPKWLTNGLVPIEDLSIPEIAAGGICALEEAFLELDAKMGRRSGWFEANMNYFYPMGILIGSSNVGKNANPEKIARLCKNVYSPHMTRAVISTDGASNALLDAFAETADMVFSIPGMQLVIRMLFDKAMIKDDLFIIEDI